MPQEAAVIICTCLGLNHACLAWHMMISRLRRRQATPGSSRARRPQAGARRPQTGPIKLQEAPSKLQAAPGQDPGKTQAGIRQAPSKPHARHRQYPRRQAPRKTHAVPTQVLNLASMCYVPRVKDLQNQASLRQGPSKPRATPRQYPRRS